MQIKQYQDYHAYYCFIYLKNIKNFTKKIENNIQKNEQ